MLSIAVIIIGFFVLSSFSTSAEISRFEQQTSDMDTIFDQLQSTSKLQNTWNRADFCKSYGLNINKCYSTVYSFIKVSSVTNIASLNRDYFPILKTISDGGFSGTGFFATDSDISNVDYIRGSATSRNKFICDYTDSYSTYKPGDAFKASQITTDNMTDMIVIALTCTEYTSQTPYQMSPYSYGSINGSIDLYMVVNLL